MSAAPQRLRILIIDDNVEQAGGELLTHRRSETGRLVSFPGVEKEQADLFDVRWISNVSEAKEYLYLLGHVLGTPSASRAWIPDVLCFDYALTQRTDSVQERFENVGDVNGLLYREVSPLPELRLLSRTAPVLDTSRPPSIRGAKAPGESSSESLERAGSDVRGCYVGSALVLSLGDHPVAPVPFTRHERVSVQGTGAEFLEWFLEDSFDYSFGSKYVKSPTWSGLLREALPRLRARLKDRMQEGRILLVLEDLLGLAQGDARSLSTMTVGFRSIWGHRSMSAAALFADIEGSEAEVAATISEWARSILTDVLGDHSRLVPDLLLAGFREADHIWKAYESPLVLHRDRLSELSSDTENLKREEWSELDRLSDDVFKVVPDGRGGARSSERCTANVASVYDIGHPSDRVKRWAALILMVRLVVAWIHAKEEERVVRTLDEWDFLLALHPLPSFPVVTFFHETRQGVRSTAWGAAMRRWKEFGSEGERSLDLNLGAVLAGEAALLPGESLILDAHAREICRIDPSEYPEVCFWNRAGARNG